MAASRRSASSMARCTRRSSVSPSSTNSIAGRGLAAISCSTCEILIAAGTSISPRSGVSSPNRAANRLDFPVPLAPVMPTLLPRKTVKLTCSNSACGPRRSVRSLALSIETRSLLRGEAHRPKHGRRAQVAVMRRPAFLAGENAQQFVRFHGIAEQASLRVVAAMGAQEFKLLGFLNALGNDLEVKALAHVDDGPHDGGVVGVHRDIAHEGLVNLQSTDGKLLQRRER